MIGTVFIRKAMCSDHFVVEDEVKGHNGVGGFWINRTWRWVADGKICRQETHSLSLADSMALVNECKNP